MEQEKYSHEKSGRKSVPAELTIEAAMIELNRLKSSERMDIDCERLNSAINKLIEAARYQIKRKVVIHNEFVLCPNCRVTVGVNNKSRELLACLMPHCNKCGQALDWSE